MENFIKKYNVSRETYSDFVCYVKLLEEWQTKFNLVSKNSLEFVWQRHIEDSAQLFDYIPENSNLLYDFGSGAGFPAMVLAIIAKENMPDLRFKLVESITKKTLYLNAVKNNLRLENVEIINDRVENLPKQTADVITARAMTCLNNLFEYSYPFCNKETKLIFPKGRSYNDELDEAKKYWNFKLKIEKNKLCEDGVVLIIENLRRKK